jgi:hypothetical protein
VQTLRAALAMRYGLFLTTQRLEEFISALDDALLLENERSQQARLAAQSRVPPGAFPSRRPVPANRTPKIRKNWRKPARLPGCA